MDDEINFNNQTFNFNLTDISNTFNASNNQYSPSAIIFACVFIILAVIGFFLNHRLLMDIFSNSSHRYFKRKNPLMIAFYVAEMVICCISIPLTLAVTIAATDSWSNYACETIFFFQSLPIGSSSLSQMLISLDRYATMQYPRIMSRLHRGPSIIIVSISVWIFSAIITLPELLIHNGPNENDLLRTTQTAHESTNVPNGLITCVYGYLRCIRIHTDNTWHHFFSLIYLLTVHLVPLTTIMICHLIVRAKLTALSLMARARHGELPLPIPLLRRPTHVIIVTGVSRNAHAEAMMNQINNDANSDDIADDLVKATNTPKDIKAAKRRHRLEKYDKTRRSRQDRPLPANYDEQPQPIANSLDSRRRLGNSLLIAAIFFIICWIPHISLNLYLELTFTRPQLYHHKYYLYFLMIGYSHSVINPLIYMNINAQASTSSTCAYPHYPFCISKCSFGIGKLSRRRSTTPASSTNEAALGPFNPRYIRPYVAPRPRDEPTQNSMQYLY